MFQLIATNDIVSQDFQQVAMRQEVVDHLPFLESLDRFSIPLIFCTTFLAKNPMNCESSKKCAKITPSVIYCLSNMIGKLLEEFLQLDISDIDEILRNCNFSESFIRTANDLQILEAISGCYEEYKILSRR